MISNPSDFYAKMEYGFHDLPEYPMISRGEYFLKYLLVMLLIDLCFFFFFRKWQWLKVVICRSPLSVAGIDFAGQLKGYSPKIKCASQRDGWRLYGWLIRSPVINWLPRAKIQSVWAALKAVLRLHTSHLQDPSAVRPHLIPYRWPNWPKKDMERAFWRYVIRRPRFPLLLPFRFPGKLELKLGLIEPEWWQQLAWLNAVPWPPGESLSKNIFHRLGNDEFPVKLAQ